jgi:hypothetical protein
MTDRNTYLELRRGINRKRASCTDPNLTPYYETLSINLLNLASDPHDPDLLARLPANVAAIESYKQSAIREAK